MAPGSGPGERLLLGEEDKGMWLEAVYSPLVVFSLLSPPSLSLPPPPPSPSLWRGLGDETPGPSSQQHVHRPWHKPTLPTEGSWILTVA